MKRVVNNRVPSCSRLLELGCSPKARRLRPLPFSGFWFVWCTMPCKSALTLPGNASQQARSTIEQPRIQRSRYVPSLLTSGDDAADITSRWLTQRKRPENPLSEINVRIGHNLLDHFKDWVLRGSRHCTTPGLVCYQCSFLTRRNHCTTRQFSLV